MNYYKICNLDCRIGNPDQRLTADTEKWATSLSSLYMNLTKPVLDIILFSRKLAELVGWEGPAMIFAWYGLSGVIIKTISPAFGRMTAVEQQLEGEYRHLHNELLAHSEEIAFYNGQEWEEKNIDAGFNRLYAHTDMVLGKKFLMGIFDSMLVKYGATMVGYTVVGLPVFGPKAAEYLAKTDGNTSTITSDYVKNISLLINLAKAIGRLVVSYKEIQSLAGYTSLINEMDDVLDDLQIGRYKRVMVTANEDGDGSGEKKKSDEIVGF
jgi:ATP-binding cassette subfamily D (ALD) protein 3